MRHAEEISHNDKHDYLLSLEHNFDCVQGIFKRLADKPTHLRVGGGGGMVGQRSGNTELEIIIWNELKFPHSQSQQQSVESRQ